jgi:hypothetical protein
LIMQTEKIVRLSDRRPPPEKPTSQYERYSLPFFNGKKRCTWDITPIGNYTADYETGKAFAVDFLKSCDGSVGWASLMPSIVADMILAGTSGSSPDGRSKVNGIVIGFMSVIGRALVHSRVLETKA